MAKYIPLETKDKKVFINLIDQALAFDMKKVLFSRRLLAKKNPIYTQSQARIILVHKGEHVYTTLGEDGFKDVRLTPGSVLFAQRDGVTGRSSYQSHAPMEMLTIVFWPDFIRFVISRHEGNYEEWTQVWYHSHSAVNRTGVYVVKALDELVHTPDSEEQACLLVKTLLHISKKHLIADSTQAITKSYRTYQNIMVYLCENFDENINRESVAHIFSISPSHVSKLFAAYNEHNFNTVLKMLRLEQAEELLKNTTFLIAEIAEQCGFINTEYFIKTFRLFYGETPGGFRRKAAAE